MGWGLSAPGVSRRVTKGVPRYGDDLDTFILSGAEDLVPVERECSGSTRYRPRTEGLFARIVHCHTETDASGAPLLLHRGSHTRRCGAA